MLVEDDNNLREIYEARLLAEGYEIIAAHDGEEALALAVKEKPDLIISDVMMPKISGFDMLDILRSTPETKNTKVIMMTALSQAEDKSRADKLGADRYLVKSQVTLEDVAKIAREVLEDGSAAATPAADPVIPATPVPAAAPVAAPVVVAPVAPTSPAAVAPAVDPAPTATAPAPVVTTPAPAATTTSTPPVAPATSTLSAVKDAQTSEGEKADVDEQIKSFVSEPATTPKTADPSDLTSPTAESPSKTMGERVVKPLASQTAAPDLGKLLADEERKNLQAGTTINPDANPSEDPNLISL